MAPRVGFEPTLDCLKNRGPGPLDERGREAGEMTAIPGGDDGRKEGGAPSRIRTGGFLLDREALWATEL